ncbi:MAG: ROK family protein [Ktedonobacteraceae bacterium]
MPDSNAIHDEHSYIGIDIGGTNTRIGLFSSLDNSAFELLAKFPTFQNYQQQYRSVIVAPNLPSYVDQPFAQNLSERLACPVRLAHDAVCGLLAEIKFGALQSYARCAYLTVSTGTGAALHLAKANTHLISSIEIGHQILDGNSLVCLCGQTGCLETFTGGKQITLRYGHTPAEITDSTFWETFCDKLALGLVNLAMLTRVDAVAVSGAIMLNNAFIQILLPQKVDALIKGAKLELSLAVLGEDTPLVGAAMLLAISEDTILH